MKLRYYLQFALVFILLCIPAINSQAAENNPYIQDNLELLNDKEEKDLTQHIKELNKKYDVYIRVITYDFEFEQSPLEKNEIDIYVCMAADDRSIEESAYDGTKKNITVQRAQKATDKASPYFTKGTYYDGFECLLNQLNHDLKYSPKFDQIYFQLWFQILISLLISGLVIGSLLINIGGKTTTTHATYLDNANSRVLAGYDHYLRTSITRTRIQKNNSSSGGGGGSSSPNTGKSSF